MYSVYILESLSTGRYYIGQSKDIIGRLKRHNAGYEASTRGKGPWQLRWHREFESRSEAYREERRLKNLKSRRRIKVYVSDHGYTESGL